MTTQDAAITDPSINTTMLGLSYFFIIAPIILKNIAMPILLQKPIQSANIRGKWSNNQNVNELRNALNIIMYIPVDAATYGGTPIPINTGLNTIPPPNPTAEARPPPIDAAASLNIEMPVNDISFLFHPILVFFFNISSFCSLKICTIEMTIVIVRNEKKMIQSAALHF